MDYLDHLEAEAIYILREVAGQFENPALLFSGGKDSITLVHLAKKAFRPGKFPFPLVHIDTGHNFPETIQFRDWLIEQIGERLIVGSVQDSIDQGKAVEQKGSAVHVVTRRRPEPKNEYSRYAMNLVSGIPKDNARSFGIYLTGRSIKEKMCAYSPSLTGLNWMCGITSKERILNYHQSILATSVKSYGAMGNGWQLKHV
jgi:hypothetical protein